jgi:hypothetical protein
MGIPESFPARRAVAVVAERDDEPAKPAPAGSVGKGSSAPSEPLPAAQPEPNAQRIPQPQIPKLPLNPDGTIKGGNKVLVTALLSKNAGIFFGETRKVRSKLSTPFPASFRR